MPRILKVAVINVFVFLILSFPSKDFSFASQIGMGWRFNSQWVKQSKEGRRGASWYEGAATVCGPNAIFVFETCLEGMVPEYTKYTICPNNHPACLHRPFNGPKGSLWSWGQCQLAKNASRSRPTPGVCVGWKARNVTPLETVCRVNVRPLLILCALGHKSWWA